MYAKVSAGLRTLLMTDEAKPFVGDCRAGRTHEPQTKHGKTSTAMHILRYRGDQGFQKRFCSVAAAAFTSIDSGDASGSTGAAVDCDQK